MLIQTPINPYLQFTAPSGDPTIDRHRLRLLLQALTPLLTATGGKVTVYGTKLIVSYSDVGFVPTTSEETSNVEIATPCHTTSENSSGASEQPHEAV